MLFDLFVLILVIGAVYLGYKNGTHIELYRIGRVFLGMTLAGLYGSSLGWKLTSMGILSANTKAIVNLIGFLVLFLIYWALTLVIVKIVTKFSLHNHKLNNYLGAVANGIVAVLVISFSSFVFTQLTIAQNGSKAYLRDNSFSYIHMDRFCRKATTAEIVDKITGDSASQLVIQKVIK